MRKADTFISITELMWQPKGISRFMSWSSIRMKVIFMMWRNSDFIHSWRNNCYDKNNDSGWWRNVPEKRKGYHRTVFCREKRRLHGNDIPECGMVSAGIEWRKIRYVYSGYPDAWRKRNRGSEGNSQTLSGSGYYIYYKFCGLCNRSIWGKHLSLYSQRVSEGKTSAGLWCASSWNYGERRAVLYHK